MRYFLLGVAVYFGSLAAFAQQPGGPGQGFGPGFNPMQGYRPNPLRGGNFQGVQPGMRGGSVNPGYGQGGRPADPGYGVPAHGGRPVDPGFSAPGRGFGPAFPANPPGPVGGPGFGPGPIAGPRVVTPEAAPMPMLPEMIDLAADLVYVANRMIYLIEANRTDHVTIEEKILEPVIVNQAIPTAYGPLFASRMAINIHEKRAEETQDFWISVAVARFKERATKFKEVYQGFRNVGMELKNWNEFSYEFAQLNWAYQNAIAATFFYTTLLQRQFIATGRFNGNGYNTQEILSRLYELSYVPFPGDPFYRRGLTVISMDIMLAMRMVLMPVVLPVPTIAPLFPGSCYEYTVAPILVNPLVNAPVGFMPLPFWSFPGGGVVPGQGELDAAPQLYNSIPAQGYGANFGQGGASYPYVGEGGQQIRYDRRWPGEDTFEDEQGLIPQNQVPQNYYRDRYQYSAQQMGNGNGQQQFTGNEYIPNQQYGQQLQQYRGTQSDRYYQGLAQGNGRFQQQGNQQMQQQQQQQGNYNLSSGTNVPYSPNYRAGGNQQQQQQYQQQGNQRQQYQQQGNQQGYQDQGTSYQQERARLQQQIKELDNQNGNGGASQGQPGVDLNNNSNQPQTNVPTGRQL